MRRFSPGRFDVAAWVASCATVNIRYAPTAFTGTLSRIGHVPLSASQLDRAITPSAPRNSVTVGHATAGIGSAGSGMRVTLEGRTA